MASLRWLALLLVLAGCGPFETTPAQMEQCEKVCVPLGGVLKADPRIFLSCVCRNGTVYLKDNQP